MIEIYAITPEPAPPLAGFPDLHAVSSAGLAAVCGPAPEAPPSPAQLWEREDVIENLMRHTDLLPARYGTRVADDEAAARALAAQRELFATALEHVRGAVELAVRVHGAAVDPPSRAPADGAAYMQSKADAARERATVENAIHAPLADLSRANVSRTTFASGRELLRAAYLVDRAAVEPFADRVRRLQADNSQWQLLCTGPWPPYSFVDG